MHNVLMAQVFAYAIQHWEMIHANSINQQLVPQSAQLKIVRLAEFQLVRLVHAGRLGVRVPRHIVRDRKLYIPHVMAKGSVFNLLPVMDRIVQYQLIPGEVIRNALNVTIVPDNV